jgi:REP element-mobilizing transposase RayT
MPRLPRLHVPGGCYHVVLRGNHREAIFSSSEDRSILNAYVADAIECHAARIHAFCWMTNHLHALIQIGEPALGLIVKRFAMRYARYRHKQLRTTGHLFERRYKAWLVDTDNYFIALLRYIHLNPVEARIVDSADEYPWSSHRAYLGLEVLPWVTIDFGLSLFGKSIDVARLKYREVINDIAISERTSPSLLPSDDPRVIGTDRFLASLPPPRIQPRSRLSLLELAMQVCEARGITLVSLQSPSKSRGLSDARAEVARRSVELRVATLRAVARFLNRDVSVVCRLISPRQR